MSSLEFAMPSAATLEMRAAPSCAFCMAFLAVFWFAAAAAGDHLGEGREGRVDGGGQSDSFLKVCPNSAPSEFGATDNRGAEMSRGCGEPLSSGTPVRRKCPRGESRDRFISPVRFVSPSFGHF